jgi:hypothetical protein
MNRETLLPSDTILVAPSVDDNRIQKADTVKLESKESGRQAVQFRKVRGDELTQNTDYSEKFPDESFISKNQQESEEDALAITFAATGLEHLTMSESVDHGEADHDGSNDDADDLDTCSGSQKDDDVFDAFLRETVEKRYLIPKTMREDWLLDADAGDAHSDLAKVEEETVEKRYLIVPKTMREEWLLAAGDAHNALTKAEDESKVIKKRFRSPLPF